MTSKDIQQLKKLCEKAKRENLPCFVVMDSKDSGEEKTFFYANIIDRELMYSFFMAFDDNPALYPYFQQLMVMYEQVLERDQKQRDIAKRFGIN